MSIRDVRSIEIDRAGLSDAVSRCRKVATSLGIPDGLVRSVALRAATNEVEFCVSTEAGAARPAILPAAALGALALAYLIAVRVPVPKQATKSISVTEQGVTIVFEFLMNTPPPVVARATLLPPNAVDWRA